jgi:hypothetical protein
MHKIATFWTPAEATPVTSIRRDTASTQSCHWVASMARQMAADASHSGRSSRHGSRIENSFPARSTRTSTYSVCGAEATEPPWNGYLLTVACPCGVVFGRRVTPVEADADLVRIARLN